ncbi:MAG: low temperature requirement protein A [Acidimicrobiales bacterium]
MKGIEVPEREEDFTADPVELFFDLAFVFAFAQLVGHLIGNHDWTGVGEAGLIFLLLWLPWSQFTWAANAVSGNGRLVRLLFLVGTAVSIPMAASVTTAFDDGGPVFAISLCLIYALAQGTQFLAAERGSAYHVAVLTWAVPQTLALGVLLVGAFVDGSARVGFWVAALALVTINMIRAGRSEWIVRTGHFAERHGLILIIALGEVIVAIAKPVADLLEEGEGLSGVSVTALVASGAFAALLWWSYFDRPGPALEHRGEGLETDRDRGRYARDVYSWAHAPVVAGVILSAAALEEITLHPRDAVPDSFRLMFFGGLALFAFGVAIGVWRAFRAVAMERLAATALIAVVLAVAGSWDGIVVLIVVDAILLVMLIAEHVRIERPREAAGA